jgi:hypothetical protein
MDKKKAIQALQNQLDNLNPNTANDAWTKSTAAILQNALGAHNDLYVAMAKFKFFSVDLRAISPERVEEAKQMVEAAMSQIQRAGIYKEKTDVLKLLGGDGFIAYSIALFGAGIFIGGLLAKFLK